ALRNSKTIDVEAQKQFQSFLEDVVLPPRASLRHVRSYLGEPDYWFQSADGIYYRYALNRGARQTGAVTGSLELDFSGDVKLARCRIKFSRCLEEGPSGSLREDVAPEELQRLGLRNTDR